MTTVIPNQTCLDLFIVELVILDKSWDEISKFISEKIENSIPIEPNILKSRFDEIRTKYEESDLEKLLKLVRNDEIKRLNDEMRKLILLREEVQFHNINVLDGYNWGREEPELIEEIPESPPTLISIKKQKRGGDIRDLLLAFLDRIKEHPSSGVFLDPVEGIPLYDELIKQKTDLGTITSLIEESTIKTFDQLRRYLKLMFLNSFVFNKPKTDIHTLAVECRDFTNKCFAEIMDE